MAKAPIASVIGAACGVAFLRDTSRWFFANPSVVQQEIEVGKG